MAQTTINSLDGKKFDAYVAAPKSQNGPGLIVIHEVFGVNASMRAICDSYAAKGYIAICPDLYWRQTPNIDIDDTAPDQWPKAFDLYKSFDVEAGVRDLLATLAFMRHFQGCSGVVGAVGYGVGGRLAFLMGSRSDVECSVSYYGVGIEKSLDEIPDVRMPMLLHLADQDKFMSPLAKQKILMVASRNPVIKMEIYNGMENGFARPSSPAYHPVEAERSMAKTSAFLGEFLRDKVK
jgi:carboxymethylenebutenolidase